MKPLRIESDEEQLNCQKIMGGQRRRRRPTLGAVGFYREAQEQPRQTKASSLVGVRSRNTMVARNNVLSSRTLCWMCYFAATCLACSIGISAVDAFSSTTTTRSSLLSPPTAFRSTTTLFSQHDSSVNGDTPFSSNDNTPHHSSKIPRHVAFICDGNARWAHQHGLSRAQGHFQGADRLVELLEVLKQDGVAYCTLYAFSTENWNRPPSEIQELFQVMEHSARTLLPRLLQNGIQLRILGNLQDDRIPLGLRTLLQELQKATSTKAGDLTVCIAINYGGRQDIVQATQQIAEAMVAGHITEITEDLVASYLSTAGIPDPDLIVRTSGECRLSNFLLWNAAYAELYFSPTLWPDFDAASWRQALEWYQQRQRRFGGRKEDKLNGTSGPTEEIQTQYDETSLSAHKTNGELLVPNDPIRVDDDNNSNHKFKAYDVASKNEKGHYR